MASNKTFPMCNGCIIYNNDNGEITFKTQIYNGITRAHGHKRMSCHFTLRTNNGKRANEINRDTCPQLGSRL